MKTCGNETKKSVKDIISIYLQILFFTNWFLIEDYSEFVKVDINPAAVDVLPIHASKEYGVEVVDMLDQKKRSYKMDLLLEIQKQIEKWHKLGMLMFNLRLYLWVKQKNFI